MSRCLVPFPTVGDTARTQSCLHVCCQGLSGGSAFPISDRSADEKQHPSSTCSRARAFGHINTHRPRQKQDGHLGNLFWILDKCITTYQAKTVSYKRPSRSMFYSLPSNRLFVLNTLTQFFFRTMLSHASLLKVRPRAVERHSFGRVRTREALDTAGIWNTRLSNPIYGFILRHVLLLAQAYSIRGYCVAFTRRESGLDWACRRDPTRVATQQIPCKFPTVQAMVI